MAFCWLYKRLRSEDQTRPHQVIDARYDTYSPPPKKWDLAEVSSGNEELSFGCKPCCKTGFTVQNNVAGMPHRLHRHLWLRQTGDWRPRRVWCLARRGTGSCAWVKAHSRTSHRPCLWSSFVGVASAAASIAIKDWLIANKIGYHRFYSTPAEEVALARCIWFARVVQRCGHRSELASRQCQQRRLWIFAGQQDRKVPVLWCCFPCSCLSGTQPLTLDAVEAMGVMVNMMRAATGYADYQGVKTQCGACVVIIMCGHVVIMPSSRLGSHWTMQPVMVPPGTDFTQVEVEITGGVHELLSSRDRPRAVDANLGIVGGYARPTRKRLSPQTFRRARDQAQPLENTQIIMRCVPADGSASTDVGDVGWTVPTVGSWRCYVGAWHCRTQAGKPLRRWHNHQVQKAWWLPPRP